MSAYGCSSESRIDADDMENADRLDIHVLLSIPRLFCHIQPCKGDMFIAALHPPNSKPCKGDMFI